jgi:hypothetical protein
MKNFVISAIFTFIVFSMCNAQNTIITNMFTAAPVVLVYNDIAYNSTAIHPAIIDYHGKSYLFYHNGALPTGGNYRGSVCVDYRYYNPDGTIKKVIQTIKGVDPIK